jgi:hypothetical protein
MYILLQKSIFLRKILLNFYSVYNRIKRFPSQSNLEPVAFKVDFIAIAIYNYFSIRILICSFYRLGIYNLSALTFCRMTHDSASFLPLARQIKHYRFDTYILEHARSATEMFFERCDFAKRVTIFSTPASTLLSIEWSYGTGLHSSDISMSAIMQSTRGKKTPGLRCSSFKDGSTHCHTLCLALLPKVMRAIYDGWFGKEIVCRGSCQNYILPSLLLRSSSDFLYPWECSECFSVRIVLHQWDGC